MNLGLAILAFRARLIRPSAEIVSIAGHEGPVAIDDERHQLSIFGTCFADPQHMRAFAMAARVREMRKFGAQAFVDQKLHAPRRRSTFRSEIMGDNGAAVLGRPNGGVASA